MGAATCPLPARHVVDRLVGPGEPDQQPGHFRRVVPPKTVRPVPHAQSAPGHRSAAGAWGDQGVPLRPRSLALLRYLVAHAGRLVTKSEVQQYVWGGTHVSDSVLRVSVNEIRAALGDAAGAPVCRNGGPAGLSIPD